MTLEELQDLLDTFGGEPQNWPDAERDRALAFIAHDLQAQLIHEEALLMDGLLAGPAAPSPSPQAMQSLFDDVARTAQAEAAQADFRPKAYSDIPAGSPVERLLDFIFRPASLLGASAAAGIIVGFWDVWLKPTTVQSGFLAEFLYSALPL